MQYKSVDAFEKKLREEAPQFSHAYVFLIPDPFERQFYAEKLYFFMRHFKKDLQLKRNIDDFSSNLFQEERLFLVEKETHFERVIKEKSEKDVFLFLSDHTPILPGIVYLDLREEKPWDKTKRYAIEVVKLVKGQGKLIDIELAERFVALVGQDLSLIKNEIEKVMTFAYDRKEIKESDIEAIATKTKQQNLWKIAEGVVFGDKVLERPELKDVSEFLSLLGQVRFYLLMGIEVKEQLEKGETPSHKGLKKSLEKKILPFLKKIDIQYFIGALNLAFTLEQEAKSKVIDPSVLWDLFVIHSSHDALSFTQ